jgi:hypothetical protein
MPANTVPQVSFHDLFHLTHQAPLPNRQHSGKPTTLLQQQGLLPRGTAVRVNGYRGVVQDVELYIASYLPDDPSIRTVIPLRSPLYTIELDRSQRVGCLPAGVLVRFRKNQRRVKLFADEFQVIRL